MPASQPRVTTVSLFRSRILPPLARRMPMLHPAANPRLAPFSMSRYCSLPAQSSLKKGRVPSVEPLSTRMTSCGSGVLLSMLSRHTLVHSSSL